MSSSLPGTRLLAFTRLWFDERVIGCVFEPLVADWQREFSNAARGRRRLINARARLAFAFTVIVIAPRLVVTPGTFRTRPLLPAGGFWFVTSGLLTLPFVREDVPLRFLWLLLPASLTLMLPFAILPAIDALRRDGEEPTPADRRAALTLVAIAVCGVAIGQGWLTPAANQRWRNQVASERNGRPTVTSHGVREVTTSELIAGDVALRPVLHGTPRMRELNMRLSLALLPAVLAWLRWQSLCRPRRRSWPIMRSYMLASAATAGFIAIMPVSPSLEFAFLAPGFGPLLALGLFAFTTRTGIWLRQRAV